MGVLAGTHRCATESSDKAPTLLGVVVGVLGVVTSCVPCARVPRVEDVLKTGLSSCATDLHPCLTASAGQALSRHQSQSFE